MNTNRRSNHVVHHRNHHHSKNRHDVDEMKIIMFAASFKMMNENPFFSV